ncbi:NAD-dependent epimerase/dehydratase family protein [Hyphomicrobium sp.]|uniref:NAD-dependent epimerase/dehydratase family protein n=1 Tax=Hyphomicrobium sp. TaxID=82 RepID=UPI0025C4C171|nr:NAD-dependent epimerase/dehydratase family protein [Hyphomicrobium sp.]MCC7252223.1 NAD(P)H-binding protein [Hyphomicrobium sp.]
MTRRAVIVGGTGQIGRAVAAELLDGGWHVTLAARGGRACPEDFLRRGAAFVAMDREQPGILGKVIGDGADAVIDAVAYDDGHARQLLAIEGDVGAFVVISSASVYRDDQGRSLDEAKENGFPQLPVPITETQPTVDPGPATYSTRKVALERTLLDGAERPVTILRPGAIHGMHSSHPREWWFVKRMLDGRPLIPLAYEGRSRFHTTAAANIAALAAAALEHPESRILNIADPEALTVAEVGALIAERMGYSGRIVPLASDTIGLSPWSIPQSFVLDTRAATTLGYTPRMAYRDAVGPICAWLSRQDADAWEAAFPVLAGYSWPLFDYASEDKAGVATI